MKYCIITEEQEIFKVKRTFAGIEREIVFADIEEEDKHIQLDYASYIRFEGKSLHNPDNSNQVFNLLNHNQWLKLIPDTDDKFNLDVPSLSLMA